MWIRKVTDYSLLLSHRQENLAPIWHWKTYIPLTMWSASVMLIILHPDIWRLCWMLRLHHVLLPTLNLNGILTSLISPKRKIVNRNGSSLHSTDGKRWIFGARIPCGLEQPSIECRRVDCVCQSHSQLLQSAWLSSDCSSHYCYSQSHISFYVTLQLMWVIHFLMG